VTEPYSQGDGVAAVCSAMRLHIADESVALMCAIALRSIADTAVNRVAVVDSGGVAAMSEAVRLHQDNPELVKWSAAALRNLVDPVHVANGVLSAEESSRHAAAIIDEGGVSALVSGLEAIQKADSAATAAAAAAGKAKAEAQLALEHGDAWTDQERAQQQELAELEDAELADLPPPVAYVKAIRVVILALRTLSLGNIEVQAKMVMASGLRVIEDAKRQYNSKGGDLADALGDIHSWLLGDTTLG
jgi:hypothetical protein